MYELTRYIGRGRDIRSKRIIASVVLALLLVLVSSLPAFAQEPPLSDIESEIDAVQWGVLYQPKSGCAEYLEALKLLVVLEMADLFVEKAMGEYNDDGEVTDGVERSPNRALDWLERAAELSEEGGFDIGANINRAVEAETSKEETFDRCCWLKGGDAPWDGESMGAYENCTTVDSYIDVVIARISLWQLTQV